MDSRRSSRRFNAAERRVRALQLRRQGHTFQQIGAALGCSTQRAFKIIADELKKINEHRADLIVEVVQLELARLDSLQTAVWPKAMAGDTKAVERILGIMERRARLLGLDAPS